MIRGLRKGSTKNYFVWVYHGKTWGQNPQVEVGGSSNVFQAKVDGSSNVFQHPHDYEDVLVDALLAEYYDETEAADERAYGDDPLPESKHYFNMMDASQSPLFYDNDVVRTDSISFTAFYEALWTAYSQVRAIWEDTLKRRVQDIFYKARITLIDGRFQSVQWEPLRATARIRQRGTRHTLRAVSYVSSSKKE
ncbi:hypothetical protein AKJ16_DCAP17798 [Drosera capensis]